MSLSQAMLLAAIASMALATPASGVMLLASLALVVAFLSATQDIAVDAYRTDVLRESEMGAGAAVAVLGYRIALLWTGAGALILAALMSWPAVYVVMAAPMLVGLAASIRARGRVSARALPAQRSTGWCSIATRRAKRMWRSGLERCGHSDSVTPTGPGRCMASSCRLNDRALLPAAFLPSTAAVDSFPA